MKKILSEILCILMLAALLTGCDGENNEVVPEAEEETAQSSADSSELKFTQEKVVNRDKFLENESYEDFLSEAEKGFLIPGLAQFTIPQGITYSDKAGLYFISSYSAVPDFPSVISAVDGESGILTGEFPVYTPDGEAFTSHMGGIAAVGDYVYVSAKADEYGNYRIAKIALSDLMQQGRHEIKLIEYIKVQTSPSFINYSDGMLWVGNFYHPKGKYELPRTASGTVKNADGDENGCFVLGFAPKEDGGLEMDGDFPSAKLVISAPDKIQGITSAEGKIYLSQSYGRKNDSALLVYEALYKENTDEKIKLCGAELPLYILDSTVLSESVCLMPMSEGLCLGSDGEIMVLFESGAGKYDDGRDRTDCVWRFSA